jgi:ADP-ribose pyrophosphatase YjhB (NUDIX family)
MFVIERVRRDAAGHVVMVEGFARAPESDLESQSFACTVGDIVARIACGDHVVTVRGGPVKALRVSASFETIEDVPGTAPGARLVDLPPL